MEITKKNIQHIASTAKLHLSEEQIKDLMKDCNEILAIFQDLKNVPTESIPPSFHPLPIKNNTRDDSPKPCLTNEQALSNTKKKREEYFLGPKTL